MPSHHLEADEVFDYSTGSGPEWKSLLASCHLTLCPRCRDEVNVLEELGGALLDDELDDDDAAELRPVAPPPPQAAPPRDVPARRPDWDAFAAAHGIPRAVGAFIREERPRWHFFAPGVQEVPLTLEVEGTPARLLRFREGFTIPRHDHEGDEWLLVFTGSIRDSDSEIVFRAGDICRGGAGTLHEQIIGSDEPCVCLVLNVGSVVPTSFLGRVLKKIAGI
jgi:putative transcriptional regulator